MKPLFQLRDDADLDTVISYLGLLIGQTKAVQSNVFELSCSSREIADNFEEINALVFLTENNLEHMAQMADYLCRRKLKEVKS